MTVREREREREREISQPGMGYRKKCEARKETYSNAASSVDRGGIGVLKVAHTLVKDRREAACVCCALVAAVLRR